MPTKREVVVFVLFLLVLGFAASGDTSCFKRHQHQAQEPNPNPKPGDDGELLFMPGGPLSPLKF